MTDNNHIPDIDLKLAKEVGSLLESDRSVLSLNDPLIDQIIDHKRSLYTRFQNEIKVSKQDSWNKISSTIERKRNYESHSSSADSNLKTIGVSRTKFLKVAAAVLFGVLISLIYLQLDVTQPEIVAQAESDQITYTLSDDSRVQLRPHSTLTLLEESDDVLRYSLEGEAFFDVTKDESRRFLIDAEPGIIEVTGTSFNVRQWDGETVVYLQEGSLALNSPEASGEVVLNPGEVATVNSDASISEPTQTDGREFTAWQQNEIVFDNRPVSSIIRELEHHYSIDIQIPEQVGNETLGGTLSLESRAISLENLGIVLGGNFSSIGENTYQFVE